MSPLLSTYRFQFLDDFVFDADVLKDSLDDHVHIAEVAVVQSAIQVRQDCVLLKPKATNHTVLTGSWQRDSGSASFKSGQGPIPI